MAASVAFDGERASSMVEELRGSFNSGRTRSYEWRVKQLKAIEKMIVEKEEDIMGSLFSDLSKPQFESFLHEISLAKSACQFAVKNLKKWMKPEKVPTSITTFPSSANIVPEPFGVVLIISAWNYPFLLSLDPVIGAIAAGNSVVLKPSEIAPATASLFTRILPDYIDTSCIRVVEGAIARSPRAEVG